jgi:hypothetical protein
MGFHSPLCTQAASNGPWQRVSLWLRGAEHSTRIRTILTAEMVGPCKYSPQRAISVHLTSHLFYFLHFCPVCCALSCKFAGDRRQDGCIRLHPPAVSEIAAGNLYAGWHLDCLPLPQQAVPARIRPRTVCSCAVYWRTWQWNATLKYRLRCSWVSCSLSMLRLRETLQQLDCTVPARII